MTKVEDLGLCLEVVSLQEENVYLDRNLACSSGPAPTFYQT